MNYNPFDDQYDLVITNNTTLTHAMSLFAGYHATEFHRFETPQKCKNWLELDVNKVRTKLYVYLSENDIRFYLPRIYFQDLLLAEPINVGVWNQPKFFIGKLAVYTTNIYVPMFPIYESSNGNNFCTVGNQSYGLYRAIHTKYA